jgi:hypothetical protein
MNNYKHCDIIIKNHHLCEHSLHFNLGMIGILLIIPPIIPITKAPKTKKPVDLHTNVLTVPPTIKYVNHLKARLKVVDVSEILSEPQIGQ